MLQHTCTVTLQLTSSIILHIFPNQTYNAHFTANNLPDNKMQTNVLNPIHVNSKCHIRHLVLDNVQQLLLAVGIGSIHGWWPVASCFGVSMAWWLTKCIHYTVKLFCMLYFSLLLQFAASLILQLWSIWRGSQEFRERTVSRVNKMFLNEFFQRVSLSLWWVVSVRSFCS